MSITLPSKLEHFRHDDIVHTLKELNSQYDLPRRGSWGGGIPDLEEPITRQVVEVAIARDLKTVWGQCVYYYRMGASHIHLVLSPRLFHNYTKNECVFVKENPVPNVEVYMLPDNRLPFIVSHKPKIKQTKNVKPTSKHVAIWPFLASKAENTNPKSKTIVKNNIADQPTYSFTDDMDDTDLVIDNVETMESGMVPILSPLGHLSYISRETYEREKERPGSKLNFWRPLKTKQKNE